MEIFKHLKTLSKNLFFNSVPSFLMESMNGCLQLIAFDRLFTSFFSPAGFYDVQLILIADARSYPALAAILDWLTHLASISWWYRSDARHDEFRKSLAVLLWISKVRGYDHVCRRWPKKHANNNYKAIKHIERTASSLWFWRERRERAKYTDSARLEGRVTRDENWKMSALPSSRVSPESRACALQHPDGKRQCLLKYWKKSYIFLPLFD